MKKIISIINILLGLLLFTLVIFFPDNLNNEVCLWIIRIVLIYLITTEILR